MLVVFLVASLISGCGGGRHAPDLADKPGVQILAAAADALRATGRFRVLAEIGDVGGTRSLVGDLHLQVDATELDFDSVGRGYSARALSPDEVYLKVNAATLRSGGGGKPGMEILADRWFRYSAAQSRASGIPTVESWANLVARAGDGGTGAVTRTRLDGRPAIRVGVGGPDAVYVAATGPPYPLRVERPTARATYGFSDFGRVVPIEAPPDAIEIDQAFPAIGLVPFAGTTSQTTPGSAG
ncbi:hypothetical protein [Frankia sp. AgKG'84/4]|uniref:hypothetical protein n=1 Tax=Frankia sp. AgKG'84/4 TaxID=573490 RepID=UPI002029BEFA|nr:hypothetical protein [Frankia sp. AgKG'84/4]MCL9794264.1 hypothetical protein [Frankia sp. AgKG'84/4]